MERTILEHDVAAATARITFTHNGLSQTADYSLWHLIPGTQKVFADLGMPFDEVAQLLAIDYLERNLIPSFESGQMGDPSGEGEE